MSEFTPRSEQNFFQRLFGGRKYSAQEVDFIQGERANQYADTWGTMKSDLDSAIFLDTPPDHWFESGKTQAQWDEFTADKDRFKTFSASRYITAFGEDRFKSLLPKDAGNELFKTLGDQKLGQFKFFDAVNTTTTQGADGNDVTDVAVRTGTIDEDGTARMRSNNITADGSNQSESGDPGLTLDNAQFDAMIELMRREDQAKTGGRFSDNDDTLEAFLLENQLDPRETVLNPNREEVISDAEKIAEFFKNKGISVASTNSGKSFTEQAGDAAGTVTPTTTDAAGDDNPVVNTPYGRFRLSDMPDRQNIMQGSIVNPYDPKVITAANFAANFKPGSQVTAEDVEVLAQGLSSGSQVGFKDNTNRAIRRAEIIKGDIAIAQQNGDEEEVERLTRQLNGANSTIAAAVNKVLTNVQNDTVSYNKFLRSQQKIGGGITGASSIEQKTDFLNKRLEKFSTDLSNATLKAANATGPLSEGFNKKRSRAIDNIIDAKTQLNELTGVPNTLLDSISKISGDDRKALENNLVFIDDLQNLNNEALTAKYLNEDGSINQEAVYGKEYEPEVKNIIDKTLTKGDVAQFAKAIRSGNEEKITELLAKVDLSPEDEQSLINIFSASPTGANYNKGAAQRGGLHYARGLHMIATANMNPDSAAYKRLITPQYYSLVETGRYTSDAIDYQTKIIRNQQNQNQFDYMTDDFKTVFNNYQTLLTDINNDEDLTFENSLTRINNFFNTMRTAARNNADLSALLTQRMDVWARVTKNELQPGFWKEVFTLGFAKGQNDNLLSEEIDVDVVTQNGGPPSPNNKIIGFRGGSAFKSSKVFEEKYGPDALEELARIAIINGNKHISEAEAKANK